METKVRIFLEDPPPMRVRKGAVHFIGTGAGYDCEHIMSIETLQRAVERQQRVLKRYASGERDIYEGD